jgi:hypothetical protein
VPSHHVIHVVTLDQASAHEYSPEMHIARHVTSRELGDRDVQVAFEDLYCHGSLLSHTGEAAF